MTDRILVIEDEPAIADTLLYALNTEGFVTSWQSLARDGMQHLQNETVDLIILDVGLPDENGFELCKRIRRLSDVPILFLTARKEEVDRIVGLEIGGDDYVTKPFSPREIATRVKAILRRARRPAPIPAAQTSSPFAVDDERKQIHYHRQPLELTRYEYLILRTLISQPQRVFSRAQLMDQVWDEPEASFERAVDTHIKTLRAKLRQIVDDGNPIRTHRGLGYSLSPD